MRPVLALLVAAAIVAADPAPAALPASTQKLVDDAVATTAKARQAYDQAARKEQDKLIANLTREQDRESKKGNLDGALAIKALLEEVKQGLIQRKAEEAADVLGNLSATKAPAPGIPAELPTDCPAAVGGAHGGSAPVAIEPMMAKASVLAIPKGDKKIYTFQFATPGTVAIQTGGADRFHAEFWQELVKAGFRRAEDGGGGAWFILEGKAGTRFTAYDPPLAAAQVQIFAGKFKLVR